jgi:hypothetical protein
MDRPNEGALSDACRTITPEIRESVQTTVPYLQLRGKDPLFVAASGVLHGGSFPYQYHQKVVEWIVRDGDPHNFLDAKKNVHLMRSTKGVQNYNILGPRLALVMKKYIEHCGQDGAACRERPGQAAFMDSISDVPGFREGSETKAGAQKIRAYMWELFGRDDAVAVDRHVAGWLCNDAKLLCYRGSGNAAYKKGKLKRAKEFKKGEDLPPRFFLQAAEVLREEAARCSLKPTELQVAAWMHGVCEARVTRGKDVYLGEGAVVPCSKLSTPKTRVL